jgi:hypothetical protein
MAGRRSLIEGLNTVEEINRNLEEEFVYNKPKPRQTAKRLALEPKSSQPAAEQPPAQPSAPHPQPAAETYSPNPLLGVGRVPVGARVRTELAAALKRASLERQLQGIQPNSVQDILEESIELWLLKHRPTKAV